MPRGFVDCGNGANCRPGEYCAPQGTCAPGAPSQCKSGEVLASCRDGSLRCCMPRGSLDCGNGTNCRRGYYCTQQGTCRRR
jgi:hypothetical protein